MNMKWEIVLCSSLKTVEKKNKWQLRYLILKSNMTMKTTIPTAHKGASLKEMLQSIVFLL